MIELGVQQTLRSTLFSCHGAFTPPMSMFCITPHQVVFEVDSLQVFLQLQELVFPADVLDTSRVAS